MYKQVGLHLCFLFYCEVLYSSVPFPGHPTEVFHEVCVLQVCIVYLPAQKKMCGKLHGKIFVLLANCLQCARALVLRAICSQCALRFLPFPPRPPLLNGEFAEAYCHVHFGGRCIRNVLICLLAGKRRSRYYGNC